MRLETFKGPDGAEFEVNPDTVCAVLPATDQGKRPIIGACVITFAGGMAVAACTVAEAKRKLCGCGNCPNCTY